MKRLLLSAGILLAVGAFVVIAGGASNGSAAGTYKIDFDNAFGLVQGADFKVAGVRAGTIQSIDLTPACIKGNTAQCYAQVTIQVTQGGFGAFHSDASCQSRPQSLIGEYFIDCQPGSSGKVLKPGSTIPVTHTQSTIPGDLLQDVMRMPYRERFTLIINELGATVAARSGDLQDALRRAVPALTETDNLLNLLANDSTTLQALTKDSDSVITALADNSHQVQRFVIEANKTATATATQQANLRQSFARLPGTLEQLRPTLAKLRTTVVSNQPVLNNLDAASGQLHRFFTDLPGFSHSSQPALQSLGQASIPGRVAVIAANPTILALNQFARSTPELAQNLNIVLHDLDNRSRAVEKDPRSPGGQGFTGLEALLGYVFNQALAINTYGPLGHMLAVDLFFNKMCSPYATPATIALALKQYGPAYRQCYAWLGPNQPGVNETDPSNPSAPVPDPGGAPPGHNGPSTNAARLTVADLTRATVGTSPPATTSSSAPAASTGATGASGSTPSASNSGSAIGKILSSLGSGTGSSAPSGAGTSGAAGSSAPGAGQAQQLLNYLLAP
ncbi:MAG TPA: MlaD family protein [Solirubrobacteraceae bacterium]|jgi:virulence factor Mce-like protein